MSLDRSALIAWYRDNRARTRVIFDLLVDDAYYSRPIALRHPIVFYEGHLPAFSFNTLVKKGLGRQSIDARLEALFARGIDPDESASANGRGSRDLRDIWPSRETVRAFADEADRQVLDALTRGEIEQPGHPLLDRAEAAYSILEHEAMHQETLLYMWHRLPFAQKKPPEKTRDQASGTKDQSASGGASSREWIDVPGGRATLGIDRGASVFGWDNEHPAASVEVAPFSIERHNVTNDAFREFVDAGGYQDERWWTAEDWEWVQREGVAHPLFWELDGPDGAARAGRERLRPEFWRGMFGLIPLPGNWPVYVSHAEAAAYARWRGLRLPTEAEFQRSAFGSPGEEREHPWGTARPTDEYGVFGFNDWDPQPAGSHPKGTSAWGVEDLVGNGWEWTSTVFAPFPGFQPMASYPEYSADFFDGEHFVMKGASPATARELLRPTFRNWFRPRYPYVYATFRCVKEHTLGR
jgi:iron(II)-dependent oxidoreductase